MADNNNSSGHKAEEKSIYDVPMDLPGEKMSPMPGEKKHGKRSININSTPVYVIVAVIAAAVLFGGWKLLFNGNNKSSNKSSVKNQTAKTTDIPLDTATQTYTSNDLGLDFKYPTDWSATEANGGIRVVSPSFKYQTINNGVVDGNFRVYIRETAQTVDDKYIGRGVAIGPSSNLTYNDPLPGQRTNTWLTNFGLDTTNNFGYFLIAGNFNLSKGQTLGPNYGTEAGTDIVAGGYSANQLGDDMETYAVPANTFSQTAAYQQAVDIVKSLQLQ